MDALEPERQCNDYGIYFGNARERGVLNEPYILEAAIPVNKIPANMLGRVHFRKVPAGHAVVAHFFGPYESSSLAYLRISEWVKSKNLIPKGAPYEVYVDDPATKKSMYEVQTDIVQPIV